jgi:hypothetical protein
MKKLFISGCLAASLFIISCNNSTKKSGTHIHEDGSTHSDHDTAKPVQHEFNIADTSEKKDTGSHSHADGTKHSH